MLRVIKYIFVIFALYYLIPRKNETVTISGREYDVRSVSHEIDHEFKDMGQKCITHKVSVELI